MRLPFTTLIRTMDRCGGPLVLAVLVLFVVPFGSYKKKLLDLYRRFAGFSVMSILSWVDDRFGGRLSKLLGRRGLNLISKGESGGTVVSTMAEGSQEAAPHSRSFDYQVFLSFRGEDVRKTFIEHLRLALKGRGITTFHDEHAMKRGGDIQLELYTAIETSMLSIVTFSPGYATSGWCLDELVKIMESRRSHGHIVLPVFYGIEPTDVRKQTGKFKKAFVAHRNDPRVDKWREALTLAANLAGFSLQNHANGYEPQFIEYIIADVVEKVDDRKLSIPKYLTGAKSLVEYIGWWLQNGSSQVEIVIIYGPVGKITNASLKDKNVILLLKQLVEMVSRTGAINMYNGLEGAEIIRKQDIRSKKIWVVLDEVKQLHAVTECPEWFFPGSKILITARKQHSIVDGASSSKFQVNAVYVNEPAELFRQCALNRSNWTHELKEISVQLLKYCADLPSAIGVLACSLATKTLDTWKDKCTELEKFPDQKMHKILRLSFDYFDSNDKDVFLHMSYFMVEIKRCLGNNTGQILQNQGNSARELIVQQTRSVQNQLNSVGESIVQLTQSVHNQLNNVGEKIIQQIETLQSQLNSIKESVQLSNVGVLVVEQTESLQNQLNNVRESVQHSVGEVIVEQTESLQNQLNTARESIPQSSVGEVTVEQTDILQNKLNVRESVQNISVKEVIIEQAESLQNQLKSVGESIQQSSVGESIVQQTKSLQNELNSVGESLVQHTHAVQNCFRGWFAL